jgi:hypothetical protein
VCYKSRRWGLRRIKMELIIKGSHFTTKLIYCKDCDSLTCTIPEVPEDRCLICNGPNIKEETKIKNIYKRKG